MLQNAWLNFVFGNKSLAVCQKRFLTSNWLVLVVFLWILNEMRVIGLMTFNFWLLLIWIYYKINGHQFADTNNSSNKTFHEKYDLKTNNVVDI